VFLGVQAPQKKVPRRGRAGRGSSDSSGMSQERRKKAEEGLGTCKKRSIRDLQVLRNKSAGETRKRRGVWTKEETLPGERIKKKKKSFLGDCWDPRNCTGETGKGPKQVQARIFWGQWKTKGLAKEKPTAPREPVLRRAIALQRSEEEATSWSGANSSREESSTDRPHVIRKNTRRASSPSSLPRAPPPIPLSDHPYRERKTHRGDLPSWERGLQGKGGLEGWSPVQINPRIITMTCD